jgi:hypothetical protein
MGRVWLGVVAAFVLALGAAQPAGAVQIGIGQATTGVVPNSGAEMSVSVLAAAGERNDVTVRATDPVPVTDQTGAAGWPLTVTVTDRNATFDPTPLAYELPCQIVDAHTARCTAPAGTFFEEANLQLQDGNNRAQFAADTVPLREYFSTGDGNDTISTGPFVGDGSNYRFASDTGGGNDTIQIGPAVRSWPSDSIDTGLAIYSGAGNDSINSANGAFDEVVCEGGKDTLVADPFDTETIYTEDPGSCETRLPPGVSVP